MVHEARLVEQRVMFIVYHLKVPEHKALDATSVQRKGTSHYVPTRGWRKRTNGGWRVFESFWLIVIRDRGCLG